MIVDLIPLFASSVGGVDGDEEEDDDDENDENNEYKENCGPATTRGGVGVAVQEDMTKA